MQGVHVESGRPVAIKYLSTRLLQDEEFRERFRQEARLLAEVHDPGLVDFMEYVESTHGAAIVMELVDGVSLAQLINAEGPTGPEAALYILKGSLLGLAAAHHAGIVHRDYKPGNILVDGEGRSRLADFGVAVRAGDNVPFSGTPAYMPPEQWGGREVTPATDVYAATAVFYECITGHQPYPARTLPQLALAHRTAAIPADDVPDPLRPLIHDGLAKNVGDRPQSATAFLSQLEAIAFAAYGIGWEERGREKLKERAALLALLFPLSRPADATGAAAMGATVLAEGDANFQAEDANFWNTGTRRRGPKKSVLLAAAGVIAILIAGGGTAAVVVAGNSGNSSAATPSVTPTSSTDTPSDSGSPTDPGTPTDTTSPSPSPTDTSATPTTTPATTTQPASNPTAATTPKKTPTPTPTKKTTKPSSPSPSSTPFQVTGVTVTVSNPNSDGNGTYSVTVTTKGSPAGTVTVTASSGTVTVGQPSGSASAGFSGRYSGAGICQTFTIHASASPGSASNDGSYDPSSDTRCSEIT